MLLGEGQLMVPVNSRAQVIRLVLIICEEVVPLRERRLASLPVKQWATGLFLLAEFRSVHETLGDRREEGTLHLLIGEFSCSRGNTF